MEQLLVFIPWDGHYYGLGIMKFINIIIAWRLTSLDGCNLCISGTTMVLNSDGFNWY